MIAPFFHRWELRLAEVSRSDRVVRPFEWGLDWLVPPDVASVAHLATEADVGGESPSAGAADPREAVRRWVDEVMRDTDAFFAPAATRHPRQPSVMACFGCEQPLVVDQAGGAHCAAK